MRAITLKNGELGMQQDRVSPSSGEGEVLLNLRLAGICRTDLELVSGYYPYSGGLSASFCYCSLPYCFSHLSLARS